MLIAAIALCCAGCRTIYYHPNDSLNNPQQFERDKYECEQQAAAWSNNMGAAGNPLIILDQTKNCLEKLKGWRKVKK
jgi:hypothetical protein